jgi:uncharacterized protein (DUF1501 family)
MGRLLIEGVQGMLDRRLLLSNAIRGVSGLALASLLADEGLLAMEDLAETPAGDGMLSQQPHFAAKAKHCIFLFMWGAPSHIDLFDPKPVLNKHHGQPIPEEIAKDAKFAFVEKESARLQGSPFAFKPYGKSGIELSELLPNLGRCVDDMTLIRTTHTDSFNHRPGQNLMNTGFPRLGRPAMGAWLQYGLGSPSRDLPGFVVLRSGSEVDGGSSNWSSGFLPSQYQGVALRREGPPILNLENPEGVSIQSHRASLDAIQKLNTMRSNETGDDEICARIANYELAFRMQSTAPELCDLSLETEQTQRAYGIDREDDDQRAFARNCLLARRLVERGVRFVNIYLGNWDAHFNLTNNHKRLCQVADQPIAALLEDLKARGMLDSTLVVWAGEFGRTPVGENRNQDSDTSGRDHHPNAFTTWMAGGGTRAGSVVGQTDDLGWNAVSDPVHVNDFQATLLHLFGLDHKRLIYRFQGRDFRLTDVAGKVIDKIVA